MWVSQNSIIPKPFDIYLSRFITVLSPGISAIILIWNNKKRIKLNHFTSRKSAKYFYLLIPILTLLISIITLTLAGFSNDLIVTTLKENWDQLLIHFVLQVLIIGIGEELGWRGWLLPNLNQKYSLLKAMILVLIIWTLWHFPILFQDSEFLIPWLLIITGLTIILTWFWKRFGNNILLFAIIHGSVNYPQFFWDNQLNDIDSELLLSSWKISGYFYFGIGFIFLISMQEMFRTKHISQNENNTVGNNI